jgi:hypothetical protein
MIKKFMTCVYIFHDCVKCVRCDGVFVPQGIHGRTLKCFKSNEDGI